MGKLKEFNIILSNPQAVYYPGQVLEGHVVVTLSEPMKMRAIKLKFIGDGRVCWTERHTTGSGNNRRTESRVYEGKEHYLDFDVVLYSTGLNASHLQAGRFTFPFSYSIPPNTPPSYESMIGYIRYELSAVIDKPWSFNDKAKTMFTILPLLDLNNHPTARRPLDGQKTKTLCCLCCKSGPISVNFHIDRAGYVPGETIVLKANISNNSSRVMEYSRIQLYMVTTYSTSYHSKVEPVPIATLQRGSIRPGCDDSWVSVPMVIPMVPSSYMGSCSIIGIKYLLQLEVVPSGPSFQFEVPFDIIIGTVPLGHGMPQQQQQQEQQQPQPSGFVQSCHSVPVVNDQYSASAPSCIMVQPPPGYAK